MVFGFLGRGFDDRVTIEGRRANKGRVVVC